MAYQNTPIRARCGINGAKQITGYSQATISRKAKDPETNFPPPHFLGRDRRWFVDELENWCEQQMAKRASEKPFEKSVHDLRDQCNQTHIA